MRSSWVLRWRALHRCADRGSTIPLVLGFVVLAALLVLGAVAASVACRAQRDLAAVCDGAAVAAAQSVDEPALYAAASAVDPADSKPAAGLAAVAPGVPPAGSPSEAADRRLPLAPAAVEAALARYVAAGGYAGDPDGLSVSGSVGADGTTAVVQCTRTVRLPFGALFGYPNGLPRRAGAAARSPIAPSRG